MRLGSKIFLTSALVIVVLAGVGVLSLLAVDRLVFVNREIATQAVPALRLTASTREAIAPLAWLEARALVLGDARYAKAWTERAGQVSQDLRRLSEYAVSQWEALHLREASVAFEGYRRIVAKEGALLERGERGQALRLIDTDGRAFAEEVQESLDALMAATHTRVLAAQAEAARLEARTWTAVLVALGAAVCLALLGAALVDPRLDRASPRRRPRPAHGETETPHGHHRAELRAAAPARQSDPRDVAPAGGARGARPRATRLRVARGPRRRGDPSAGRGGGRHPRARAVRVALRVPRRHGAAPPGGGQPRLQRYPLHHARVARRSAAVRLLTGH